jgi:hypothetical protein
VRRMRVCLVTCAALLMVALLLGLGGDTPISPAYGAQTTPVPPGVLLLDTVIEEWPTEERYVHLVVDVPGPGFIATETDGYRTDPSCGERGELCWCAYGGGVRFFAFDSAGEQVGGFGTGDTSLDMWIDGGQIIADADVCLSSNIDPYPYRSFIKVYWDSDSDSDKVPDSRDACPGTPPGVEVLENGCPPGSVASPTAQATPQGQPQITIVNNTQQTICYVHISSTESEDWGPDWLGAEETLPPGGSKTFELTPGSYDMLVADCDSTEVDSQYAVAISGPTTWVIGGGTSPVSVPRDGITGIQDALNPTVAGRGPYAQGATILFSGEAVGDSYLWDWGDGRDTGWLPIPSGGVVQDQHAYDCPGTYVVAKMVQYSGGSDVPNQLYDEAEVEIYSTLTSGGPFGWQPVTGQYPDSFEDYYVTFTAPEPTGGLPPYNYYWDFGDDQVHMPDTAGNPIAHKFMDKGDYTVTLTVFDSCNTELPAVSQGIPVGSTPGSTTTPSSPTGTGCATTPLLALGGALAMVALARRNRL